MDSKEKQIIVSEERKAIWQLVIASFFYTVTFYFIYLTFHYWFMRWIYYGNKCLLFSINMLMGGLFFSMRKIIYLNTETKILKIEYRVGNIKLGYNNISNLNYISIFKNSSTENFEVNLWYNTNKHINLTTFNEIEKAFEIGLAFSNKLNIDLLDATEKGNFKWVDKSE